MFFSARQKEIIKYSCTRSPCIGENKYESMLGVAYIEEDKYESMLGVAYIGEDKYESMLGVAYIGFKVKYGMVAYIG